MTDTDREKWARVATRIGKWKPCDMMPVANGVGNYCDSHQQYTMRAHDCLMGQLPDPSDPAMIVAMLDYIRAVNTFGLNGPGLRGIMVVSKECLISVWRNNYFRRYQIAVVREGGEKGYIGDTLHAALIDAIDELPKEN
jgi:hypothetical protein